MNLIVIGKNKKVHDQEFDFASRFYASKLMSTRLINRLTVRILFDNVPKYTCGLTDPIMDESSKNPRRFNIYIRKTMSRHNQLSTLAHEFVHVKQYAKGELNVFLKGTKLKWQKDWVCTESMNYYEYPWEIEAFGREPGLYRMYAKALEERNALIGG